MVLYMSSDTTDRVTLQVYRNDLIGSSRWKDLLERTSSSEARMEETIDGSSLFGYQDVEFTHRAEPLPNLDFSTNGEPNQMRLKRETAREDKDCELNDERCKKAMLSIQDYLKAPSSKTLSSKMDESMFKDLRMCMDCKKSQQLTSTTEAGNGSARPLDDRHQAHNSVVVPNGTSNSFESSVADIELLDDGKAEDGSRYQVVYSAGSDGINRTEATTAQTSSIKTSDVSQNAESGTSTNTDTTVVSIHHTSSDGTTRTDGADLNDGPTTSVSDVPPSSEPTVSDSSIVKIPNGERISTISTNVTSEPGRRTDMIGIINGDGDGTEYPAARPSHEGHSTNQLTATANEARSIVTRWPFAHKIKVNPLEIKSDGEPGEDFGVTVETGGSMGIQVNQVNQENPVTWTIQPVCFYGPLGQFGNEQTAPGSSLYPDLSPHPSYPQHGPSSHGSSSQSNHMQMQSNKQFTQSTTIEQFMPRLNYAGNPAQVQPTGPGVGFTGPGVPNFSLTGQQPAGTSRRPPYFCTYMPIPTMPFSSIAQPHRSSTVEKQDSPVHSAKSNLTVDSLYKPAHSNTCPPNSRPCDNDGYCVPNVKWCDGFVDCTADASDEIVCSCRDRIPRNRLCDGYFDCPHGEDELDCFGCPENSFSCGDWEHRRNLKNCVPLEQRCDGVKQCRNGKDELDCDTLSPSYIDGNDIFMIGYTQGYLHKNIRGRWYPVCASELSWVIDACESETEQPLTAMPEIRIVRLTKDGPFHGPYVNGSDGKMQFVSSCSDTAVFVKCPPLPCGTRIHSRQNSSPAFNGRDSGYVYKRQAEEKEEEEDEGLFDSEPRKFAKLYRETLGLLEENRLKPEERDGNDTLVGLQSRVVGGRASRPMAWPYLVAIYKDGDFHCGGVILNEVWVLTAAHCMEGYEMHHFEVRAGMLRRLSFSPTTQLRRVRNVMIHSDYHSLDMQNDVALVVLDMPLLFNRWVRQVCLPPADVAGASWKQNPTSQSTCIAIGWGATREHGPDPDHLREVEVPILPSCKYSFDQNDATICAGYLQGGHDACQGDSGGPLMCRNSYADSQWYVAGLISHGDGCARPNEPGVYTKVSHFVQWIREMSEKSEIPSNEGAPLAGCLGFSCLSGLGRCLPIEKHCDRFVDCLDAEDEIDCFSEMSYGQYRQLNGSNEFVRSMLDKKLMDRASNDTADNQIDETVHPFVPYKPQKSTDKDEKSNAASGDTTAFEMSGVRLTFSCTKILQTIMIRKRCDRRVDCQDGTDEDDCTCRDFLANSHPAAICDGHPDCDDRTDENNCGLCKEDEFLCGRSGMCIPNARRCNGKFDCPLREDEIDCLALIDEDHMSVDDDNRPLLNAEGLLSRYENGTWRTRCFRTGLHDNDTAAIGENTCQYLGFASLRSVDTLVVNKTELATRSKDWGDTASDDAKFASNHGAAVTTDGACTALRIRCRPSLSGSADSYLVVDPRTGSHNYLWPWLAAIFVDGRYRCSALLLEPNWLLSNARCTRDIRLSMSYTTALLGQSRSYLYVDGPYQQISIVDQIKNLKQSDVSLLHLKTAVNFTHHVLPLFVEKKIYPPSKNDLCIAIGTDEAHVTRSIFVQPILDNCDKCRRCFIEIADSSCSTDRSSSSWSGTVFCRSRKGWYPAAVFHGNDGPCSFRNIRNLTSIDYVQAHLTQALEEKVRPIAEPTCNGVRCNIGQCVPWNRVCDGVLDCRDGADERVDSCNRMQGIYDNNANRKCTKSELRCRNGECIPRNAFCDDKVDCSDGTDEPVGCTCAEYLELTAPGQLCDGVRHCFDKSDESPEVCQCTESSFKCNTESGNVTCLPQDFVCDGYEDCPNKEDEKQCRMVKEFAADRPGQGEVMQRSYGVWHSRCFSAPVTSQEEARAACEKLGYANGTIDQGIHPETGEPTVPSRDYFYFVRLSAKTWIHMRDDKPLITLVSPEEPCHRLFVKCTS